MFRRSGLLGPKLVLFLLLVAGLTAASAAATRAHSNAATVKIGWVTGLTGTQATNSGVGDAGHGRRAEGDQHDARGRRTYSSRW